MCSVCVWVLVFYHQGCLPEEFEVFDEKGSKRETPFLNAQDEELDEPKYGPGTVGEVAGEMFVSKGCFNKARNCLR